MRNILLISLIGVALFATLVLAVNIDFRIDVEDRTYFPNETIPVNISVLNRDVSVARDVNVSMVIGKREFSFNLGSIKSDDSIIKNLTLPEFPPGDYIIKGTLNYTDFFDKVETLTIYNSFHVRFPEMQRLPRNIIIKEFSIPDNVTAGKTYTVSIKVSNDGSVAGDLIIGLSSMDVDTSKQIHLEPGQAETININVKFYNAGISVAEARIYALVDNVKYLLAYDTKNIFVKEAKAAKIELDKTELIDEPDNEINQNDAVKLQIYLKNTGNDMASDINAVLSSSVQNIEVTQSEEYKLILAKESVGKIFEIETKNAGVGSYNLSLIISFVDSFGTHTSVFSIPIEMKADIIPPCSKDMDCSSDEVCRNQKCENLVCGCGNAVNHQCQKYACCSNFDCEEGYICSSEKHVCEPSQEIKADVLIVTSSKLKTNDDYEKTLQEYRKTILKEGLTSFYINVDSQKVQDMFNIQPANPDDWQSVKNVLDKIIYKIEPDYLLILGGVDIIPMPKIENTCFLDFDGVPTDDMYADLDLDKNPDIIVARIPTGKYADNPNTIINVLRNSIKLHKEFKIDNKFFVGDNCVGYKDTPYAEKNLGVNNYLTSQQCISSIKECVENQEFKRNMESDMVYFVAHGDGRSFGAGICSPISIPYTDIIKSSEVLQFKLSDMFATVACFSGAIDTDGRHNELKNDESTTVSFLNSGVAIYGGNTLYGITEGSVGVDMSIYKKLTEGYTIGQSYLTVKSNLLPKAQTECEKAVVYEKQLYGDPTIKLIGV